MCCVRLYLYPQFHTHLSLLSFCQKVVKRKVAKVARDVQLEMGRLAKAPQANEGGGLL